MSRIPKLLAAGALIAGSSTVGVVASSATASRGLPPPADVTITAAFECTEEGVTVNWTLTFSNEEGQNSEILEAIASPGAVEVEFTPDVDLEDGDTSTGSSTHPADTTDVALTVGYDTFSEQAPTVHGESSAELPVDCPAEEPPPVEEPEAPPAAEPAAVEPTLTG
jgi:hypothetical protein